MPKNDFNLRHFLPNAGIATIAEIKLTDYLLSPTHHRGKNKAVFFTRHGFARDEWEALAGALRQHASENEIAATEVSPFGLRMIVEGTLRSPKGENLQVRAIWFIDKGSDLPRLVTAYPLKRKRP